MVSDDERSGLQERFLRLKVQRVEGVDAEALLRGFGIVFPRCSCTNVDPHAFEAFLYENVRKETVSTPKVDEPARGLAIGVSVFP